MFISCFFLTYSCVSEEDVIQTEKTEQEKKTFSIFSQPSNTQGKSSKSTINYAKGFSTLMQRYDSINNTNISGLVNTNNKFEHKRKSRQNIIVENKDYYIENRLHSQTIFEENGDIWVMYPRIRNNTVDGLLIASYTDDGTNVFFNYVKKDSKLYTANVNLFQEKYDRQITHSLQSKSGLGCGGDDEESCDLDGPIITPNPGGPSGPGWSGGGGETGGGGCAAYQDCDNTYNPDTGGGGSGKTPTKDPCEGIAKNNSNSQLQDRLKGLQNLLKSSSTEEGFQMKRNPSNPNGVDQILSPDKKTYKEVSFNNDEITIGYAHTHRNADNVRGIFSFADLNAFWSIVNATNKGINDGTITNYNLYDLFSILIINDGMYMLRVYDANVVKNNTNAYKKEIYSKIEAFMDKDNLANFFNDSYQDMNESDKVFNKLNELLKQLGFAVYKSKKSGAGYTPWEKLDKNGNTKCN